MLIGTFNKISDYSSGIFRELHYRFRSTLSKAGILVICGYSFGDKGINEEIIEWVYGEKGRRIVVIHPDPSSLVATARGAIQKNWDDWKNRGSISFTEKNLSALISLIFRLRSLPNRVLRLNADCYLRNPGAATPDQPELFP